MKALYKIVIFTLPLLLWSCSKDDDTTKSLETIQYKVTFTFDWNSTDFPTDYPGNAHFSKLIGWNHEPGSTFMETGTMASEGTKDVAELGVNTQLNTEIDSLINLKGGGNFYLGDALNSGVGEIELMVNVDSKYSGISLITMVAPSPDWYVGIVDFNLYDDGDFISDTTIVGKVYDSGTDDGTTFASANAISNPQQPIYLITSAPLGNGTSIDEKFCTVTIERVSPVSE